MDTPLEQTPIKEEVVPQIEQVQIPVIKEEPVVVPAKVTEEKKDDETVFVAQTGSLEELKHQIEVNTKLLDSPNITKEDNIAIMNLVKLIRSGVYTAECDNKNILLNNLTPDDITVATSKTTTGGSFGKDLRGEQAALAFTAKLKGLKKVYLYNSGFHVVIRPWSMGELNSFFQSVDSDDNELGRLLGYYRFTIHDAFIKQKFMEIFPTCVVSCNLNGWNNNKALIKNISFHDYDTLLWAVCSLMQKEPIDLTISCLEETCKNTDTGACDINKMYLLNNTVISPAAFEFVHAEKQQVTADELATYRKDLIKSTDVFIYKDTRYELAVPTMQEYLDIATKAIASLISASQDSNDMRSRTLMNNVIIDFNRNYIPWISNISMLKPDGKVDFNTRDKSAYPSILESLGLDDTNKEFHDKVMNFIRETSGVIIGYVPPTCSKCGKQHNNKSGYVSWDVERLFFDLTYLALNELGLSLS